MKLSSVKVDTEYTNFTGGIDQERPPLSVSPGSLLDGMNYEAGSLGGYRRIDGYERYDGQAQPSDADYTYCEVTFTDTVSTSNTVTGVTSGATGTVVVVGTSDMSLTKVTGTFQAEAITVGGVAKGSITAAYVNGHPTGLGHATAKAAAADEYRTDISAPTGSGALRGLGLLNGTLYAFRDNAGGTAGLIYKETSSGWSAITLYHELNFDTGLAEISDGDTVTQLVSGATATVKRVVWESGLWSGSAEGRLILSGITGTFNAANDLQVGGVTKATSTSLATQITLSPGGRYEIIESNFSGGLGTKRMYGCDGVNRGFEFDGDVYVPLDTGMTTDTPDYLFAYKLQLFFGFGSSVQNSSPGFPYKWTAITGSAEIALGDDITGILQLNGQALGIFARNQSHQLSGSTVDDFVLDPISNEVGCIPRTAQKIGYPFCLDDRGVVLISATDAYGNFDQSTISRLVQPIIDSMRQVVVASTVYRGRNQYRLYGSDGTGVIMTIMEDSFAFTRFEYPVNVSCVVAGEDSTGKDVVYFGSDAGMVYQADVGSSFDGEDIEAYLILPFNSSGSPTALKTYRKATLEMTAEMYSAFQISPDFSYGDSTLPIHATKSTSINGVGGWWDVDNWDEVFYDEATVQTPSIDLEGTGTNMALIVYSKSAIDLGHKIDGVVTHFTNRRLVR